MSDDNKKIDTFTATTMVVVAVIFDGIPIIIGLITAPLAGGGGVIAGYIIWPFAWLTFWFWFTLKGVKFIGNKKRLAAFGLTPLIEFIPYLNLLPGWTTMVIVTILTLKTKKLTAKIAPVSKKFARIRRR